MVGNFDEHLVKRLSQLILKFNLAISMLSAIGLYTHIILSRNQPFSFNLAIFIPNSLKNTAQSFTLIMNQYTLYTYKLSHDYMKVGALVIRISDIHCMSQQLMFNVPCQRSHHSQHAITMLGATYSILLYTCA